MKKAIKLICLLAVVLLSLITVLPARTKALSNDVSPRAYYPYVIEKYDVQMVINEDNSFDITETITVNFNEERHGIIRTIPLTNRVSRLDGTSYTNHARISNINCNTKYTTSNSGGNLNIKIGDSSETLTGQKTYVISYNYALGKDQTSKYDELYFNIIGNQWDTVINNVTFTIRMPKEFEAGKLGFSSGAVGSTDSSRISYNLNGNTIRGTLDGFLNPGESLTVRCELPEGYFVYKFSFLDIWDLIQRYAPAVITLIAAILWFFGWRDRDQIIESVEFYPPENKNSLDVGYLYKGTADDQDVTSLLIYLANQGYISITEMPSEGRRRKKDNFVITRLRPYDGNDENERLFMEGLFAGKSISTSESDLPVSVTFDDLYDRFYMTMNTITMNENSKANQARVFEKSTLANQAKIAVLMLVVYIMMMLPIIMTSHEFPLWLLLFPAIAIAAIVMVLMNHPDKKRIAFICLWSVFFGGIPMAMMAGEAISINRELIINLVVGLVSLIVLTILMLHSERRTEYGKKMLGKIKGFRNFLMSAEKDRLEALVADNPTYFYDILPYTYVLGVSDKWINKFESIAMQAPDWYITSGNYSVRSFGSFMNSTMQNAGMAMSSSPSSGGSGGSGGGSSGGGSGGGGGSSW